MKFKPLTTGSGQTGTLASGVLLSPHITINRHEQTENRNYLRDRGSCDTIPAHWGQTQAAGVAPCNLNNALRTPHSASLASADGWIPNLDIGPDIIPVLSVVSCTPAIVIREEGRKRVKMFYEREKYSLMMVSTIRPCQTSSSW